MDVNRSQIEKTSTENNFINFQEHEYYGSLIDSYIQSILKSGLLLDEDLEVLLNMSNFRNIPEQSKYRPPLSLLASLISCAALSYVAKKYQLPLIVIPSVLLTLKLVITEGKDVRRRNNNKEIINRLIEIIKKIHKLNISIIRYMKARADLGKAKDQEFLTLYNRSVEEFLHIFSRNASLFKFLMDNLMAISGHSKALLDDYKSLEHLTPRDIIEEEKINSIENCVKLTQKIQDLHVLFASKLLSYIGIVFNCKSSNLSVEGVSNLIDQRLPKIVGYLQHHHDFVKKQFISLRQSMKKKTEYKLKAREVGKKHISTKLQETLVNAVNNLSIILEKSQNVLDRIENDDENIGNAVVDLRNHTFATYESLDLICKLYGILSNSTIGKHIEHKSIDSIKTDKASAVKLPTVNYDDHTQPLEERFELYVGAEDAATEYPTTAYEEDQSGTYLSLMLQELKQSLKQHQRFIEAKNRRGSEDDEETQETSILKIRKSPPKFNLQVLEDGRGQGDVSSCLVDKETVTRPLELPMPPPPPLPSFRLINLEEEPGRVNARSMLDNIKILSSQRNAQEDVFGDSDIDTDCSD